MGNSRFLQAQLAPAYRLLFAAALQARWLPAPRGVEKRQSTAPFIQGTHAAKNCQKVLVIAHAAKMLRF